MKKEEPLISVIMAEYNTEEELLIQSIQSILNQSYSNFELLLINDCSKNNVEKIVKKFKDDRIKLYKNEKNMGLVYSLNRALKLAKGKYIARMDTDDYSYRDRIKLQVEFLNNNIEYDIIGGNAYYYDGKKIWGETNLYGSVSKKQILNSCPLIHPSVMYRKSVMDNVGGYLEYDRCEDYATWIEMFVKGYRMFNLKEKLIRYHLSLNDYKKRSLKTRKDFFKMLKREYIKMNPTKKDIFKVYFRNMVAGILPYKLIYNYHKRRCKLI